LATRDLVNPSAQEGPSRSFAIFRVPRLCQAPRLTQPWHTDLRHEERLPGLVIYGANGGLAWRRSQNNPARPLSGWQLSPTFPSQRPRGFEEKGRWSLWESVPEQRQRRSVVCARRKSGERRARASVSAWASRIA